MPPLSWIWKHFIKNDDGKVECHHCHRKLSVKGGSTTLRYHLEKTHFIKGPAEDRPKLTMPFPVPGQSTSSQAFDIPETEPTEIIDIDISCRDASGRMISNSSVKQKGAMTIAGRGQTVLSEWVSVTSKRPCTAARAAEMTRMAVGCVVKDLQPLSFCEDEAMRGWLLYMEPNYQPPTHKTLHEHLMKLYDVNRTSLMSELKGTEMSITVDGWTNSQMVGFFSIMGHYINDKWEMKSYNLHTPSINGRHTGENLSEAIDSTLQEWDIQCFTCVHDTASNMNKGLRLTNSVRFDFGCLAHILQLAINDAFEKSAHGKTAKLITKIRELVKYKGKSENLAREIRKFRDQLLQPDDKKRELQMDCDTRWNSTCIMLESFLNLHTVVDLAVKSVCNPENKQKFYFTPDEITHVTDIVNLLANLKKTTDQWQGQKFVTVSSIYPVIFAVMDNMKGSEKLAADGEVLKRNLMRNIKARLSMEDDEFLGGMSIPMIASYLDPRFKKLSFTKEHVVNTIKDILKEEAAQIVVTEKDARPVQITDEPPQKVKKSFLEELLGDGRNNESDNASIEDEIAEYDRLRCLSVAENPLAWWKSREMILPKLSKLARRYLAVPATSASSERLFSTFGLVYEHRRMSLSRETAAAIVFLHENL